MIRIYHNPRCRKSRDGLKVLEDSGKEFQIIKYLENIPSKEELCEILGCLGITPEMLVRKNEQVWKESYKGKLLSNEEILDAMVLYPKLIERPIVIHKGKAVIGRPLHRIEDIL